jgi:hypothetical protein
LNQVIHNPNKWYEETGSVADLKRMYLMSKENMWIVTQDFI